MKRIQCQECDGNYVLRDGKFGVFAGCSNYPRCRSSKNSMSSSWSTFACMELVFTGGRRNAGSATGRQPSIPIISITNWRSWTSILILGCRPWGWIWIIDGLLSQKYATIQKRYSNTTHSSYIANTCSHCGALQGRNYVVEDPHEIIEELWHSRGMDKFWIETIPCPDCPLLCDIKRIYSQAPCG